MAAPDRQPRPDDNPLIRFFTGGILPHTFAALRHRNYRLFWFGSLVSLTGTWMQNIARGWLVLELTNSPFLVGLESAVAWLPAWIVSLPAGVLADRFNKRNLMIIGQSILAILAAVLAILTLSGAINIYHILFISGLTGCVVAFNAPVRQSIMIELVNRKDLLNAIALGGVVFNGARIIGPSIAGFALGLIGAGNIGTELARRAVAFGMTVVAFDPLIKSHEIVELVDLADLYGRADYISLHVPLTEKTRGMINTESIGAMKDGVVIINTARGGCVVEEDMAAALEKGKVRAYATDVWYSDPPSPDSPILSAPNVIMTPHIGASTKENMLRIGDVVVQILEDFVQRTA